jgi:hypothetical protein
MTQFPLAMKSNPECMFPDDPVKSYRMYYKAKKDKFNMKWTKREVPSHSLFHHKLFLWHHSNHAGISRLVHFILNLSFFAL